MYVRADVRVCMRPPDLVRTVTAKVIVAFPNNLVKMFIMMSRCVVYKTNDYTSKVSQGHI